MSWSFFFFLKKFYVSLSKTQKSANKLNYKTLGIMISNTRKINKEIK